MRCGLWAFGRGAPVWTAGRNFTRYGHTPRSAGSTLRGLAQFIPIARFSVKEHRARVDGRATARHLHGIIERAVRCDTVKVSAESAGAVASTMFLESLPTRQSGRLAQPDGGAGTPAGRGCHLQGRSAPPSWTTPHEGRGLTHALTHDAPTDLTVAAALVRKGILQAAALAPVDETGESEDVVTRVRLHCDGAGLGRAQIWRSGIHTRETV